MCVCVINTILALHMVGDVYLSNSIINETLVSRSATTTEEKAGENLLH